MNHIIPPWDECSYFCAVSDSMQFGQCIVDPSKLYETNSETNLDNWEHQNKGNIYRSK